jgi:hypothetical protein
MLVLPGPGIISLPPLLNGRLHDSGLPKMALTGGQRAGQNAAQEQRNVEEFGHALPPM